MSRYILAGTLLALATSAVAQNPMALLGQGYTPQNGGPPIEGPFLDPREIPWADNLPTQIGGFTATAAARFTGHVIPDVVFLSQNRPFYATAPAIHSHMAPLPGIAPTAVVRDLAVLRGRGRVDLNNPTQDALALAGAGGLQVWRFDPKYGTPSLQQVGGTEWNDVQFVTTHPADPDVIFGADSSGAVRIAERNPGTGDYGNAGTFTVTGTPLAIAAMDWDADGQSEVAVLTTTGLTVRSRTGTVLGTVATARTSGDLTLVRSTVGVGSTGVYADRVAWLRPQASGPLTELETYGPTTQSVIPLPEAFVAISAGDWTNNFDDDVLLASATNNDVSALMNLSDVLPAAPFLVSVTTGVRVAVAGADPNRPANQCAPVVADFDRDEDSDLWMAIEPTESNASTILVIDKTIHVQTPQPITSMRWDSVTGDGRMVFNHIGANETHTEVTIWKLELNGYLNPEPVVNEYVPYSGQLGADLAVNLDPLHYAAGGTFYFMIRPVRRENGFTVSVGLASLFGANNDDGEIGGIENTGPPPTDPPIEPPNGDPPPEPGD